MEHREIHDIGVHACERIGQAMNDAMQLIDDPGDRAVLAFKIAKAALLVAVDVTTWAYRLETGKKVPRKNALQAILQKVMVEERIPFKTG
jgi:hypothetical protein